MRLGVSTTIVLFCAAASAQQSSCWPVPFATGYSAQTYVTSSSPFSVGAFVHESDGSITKESYTTFAPYKRNEPVRNAESMLWSCGQMPPRVMGANPPASAQPALGAEPGVGAREARLISISDGRVALLAIYSRLGANRLVVGISKADRSPDRQLTYPVGLNPSRIMLGDFNEDGATDAAVVNYGDYSKSTSSVSILLGVGDGSFRDAVELPAGAGATTGAVADLNGDGHADIAILNPPVSPATARVLLLFGKGDGSFQPAVNVNLSGYSYSIAIGDLNGDGKPDILLGGTGISYLPGNGDGTFRSPVTVTTESSPRYLAVGDFNEDGRMDIAATDNGYIRVILAQPDGTWRGSWATSAGYSPWEIIVTDFDRDGHADVVVGTLEEQVQAHSANSGSVSVLFGRGDGTFEGAPAYPLPATPSSLASADFDGDSIPDLLLGYAPTGGATVLLGKGDTTFSTPRQLLTASGSSNLPAINGVAVADMNQDGKPDVVLANNSARSIHVLPGRGDGTFSAAITAATALPPNAVTTGDFNGDGRLDIAAATSESRSSATSTISVFLGNSTGGYSSPVNLVAGIVLTQLIAADVNGDGKLDLLAADYGTYTNNGPEKGGLLLLTGKGDGTFNPPVNLVPNLQASRAVYTDVNGDGVPDLLVTGERPGFAFVVAYLQGQSGGAFDSPVYLRSDFGPGDLTVGDFNADGTPDMMVAHCCGDTYLGLYIGNGDGTFQPEKLDSLFTSPRLLVSQDFDNDGRLDAAVTLGDNGGVFLTLLRNMSPQIGTLTLLNGASLTQAKPAPGMQAVIRAKGVARDSLSSDGGPADTLGGVTVTVTDSAGVASTARIFSLAPTEVLILTPEAAALGPAQIQVQADGGQTWQADTEFVQVSPGLMTVSSDGLPRGYFVSVAPDGSSTVGDLVSQDPETGAFSALPLDMGPEDQQVFIILYGTGFRGASSVDAAQATIGGLPAKVVEIAGNADFPGLDQVRIQVPREAAGKGLADVVFSPDGTASNTVRIAVQ
jgi:uncharacterized protein (TIGR03437 family)